MLLRGLLLILLPAAARLLIIIGTAMLSEAAGRSQIICWFQRPSCARHAQSVCTRRSGHANSIGVVFSAAFNAVTGRKKCVESLNKSWVAIEQGGDSLDHAGGIDTRVSQFVRLILMLETGCGQTYA